MVPSGVAGGQAVIETTGLRKVFGETLAVSGLDIEVRRGEVFGFLGPNGAGKTTTIKMLLGLVRPTSGEARILGHAPGDRRALARVGFLPEHFRFPPWLRAGEFLDLNARLHHMPAPLRKERVARLLDRVGLAGRGGTKLGQYSKGMSQRIGLAQAILNEPDLVILDEPTSGLDPLGRREVLNLIRELRDAGTTVFLNSHLLGEVEATCDRVAVIKKGRLVRTGTLDELTGGLLEVEIRARGWTPEIREALAGWGKAARLDEERVVLTGTKIEAVPSLASFLVGRGLEVYALSPRRLSLEELFVRIIEEAP